ncbi:SRPBCC family protein [Olleya aquimaris]|nr:SRPBCC family protein [Olleya aquimaris]
MKYTTQIIINKSIEDCFALLKNHDNMKYWQDGLLSYEHLSGEPGMVGETIKINYAFGKRLMSVKETITKIEENCVLNFNFDTSNMHNIQENYFEIIDKNTTKWSSINQFVPTKFSSRLMMLLMPKAFKKQSKKYLIDFKAFAEKQTATKK